MHGLGDGQPCLVSLVLHILQLFDVLGDMGVKGPPEGHVGLEWDNVHCVEVRGVGLEMLK